ncbi:MAG: polysaccharide pyruvyl transferase family protein [Candidatus Aminicenantes bacterium]|nr:polysaccharide pyruvyl transferase family protein [Candidatus Aminicenantes bacterium]
MNIIISGGSFVNKGAEAMLRTVQAELIRRMPGIVFYIWQLPESYCQNASSSGFIPILLPFNRTRRSSSWRETVNANQILWSLKELARVHDPSQLAAIFNKNNLLAAACRNYLDRTTDGFDAWLDISGFAYGDVWGIGGFRNVHPVLTYCRQNGMPSIFLPQAWGSFENPDVRHELCRLLGGQKTVFYSRDESSCRFLEKALGKPSGAIRAYPDMVFCFQGGGEEQGREVLRRMGCSMKRPIIGVAPNMRVFERMTGQGTDNPYLQAMVKLIDHCLSKHDVDIVLQASEIESHAFSLDDRYLCSLVAASVSRPDRCFMTHEPLSAELTKALIGRFEFLIGSRFHSLVFGFSQGIPALAVSWSHKYRELFAQFEMGDYVQECQEVDADELIMKFEKVWSERQKLRSIIIDKVNQLRVEVNALFDEVAAYINEP